MLSQINQDRNAMGILPSSLQNPLWLHETEMATGMMPNLLQIIVHKPMGDIYPIGKAETDGNG